MNISGYQIIIFYRIRSRLHGTVSANAAEYGPSHFDPSRSTFIHLVHHCSQNNAAPSRLYLWANSSYLREESMAVPGILIWRASFSSGTAKLSEEQENGAARLTFVWLCTSNYLLTQLFA